MPEVSLVKSNYVNVVPIGIKKATKFTSVGWVKKPVIPDAFPLILLAVSDQDGVVINGSSIRIELIRYQDKYYRFQFSNSISKPIYQYSGVDLEDGYWHFLSYVCYGGGIIKYYIDCIEVPGEDTIGDVGLPQSIAWSRDHRLGGGNVWIPYLHRNGQSVNMYKWRYGTGVTLHQEWLQELMDRERLSFPVESLNTQITG